MTKDSERLSTTRALADVRRQIVAGDLPEARKALAQLEQALGPALESSESRLRQVVESASEGVWVGDHTGRTTLSSRRLGELLGASGDPPDCWWELLPAASQALLLDELEAVREERQPRQFELPLTRADGPRVLLASLSPVVDRQGKVGTLALVSDVTERQRLEDLARQGQKLEAVGRLAGGIAHDFNNLLTVILGRCDSALGRTDLPPGLRRELELIRVTGTRAAELTRSILQFSRQGVMQARALDLNDVVRDASRLLARLIGEDLDMELRLARPLWPVCADPAQLQQVILNLVVNARDAMPSGGRLAIETGNVTLAQERRGAAQIVAGEYVRLAVVDTGVGMTPEVLDRAFEPFFTTKGPEGTGLGLPTVYGIVKQSGGYVFLHSQPGQGTTAEVLLPRGRSCAPAEPGALPGTVALQPPSGEAVLLVEDDAFVREFVAENLAELGYRLLVARDPEEALRLSAERPEPLALLLTDVIMPGMSGGELAQRLQAARPGLKVVFMSGYTSSALGERGALPPGVNYLEKPFTVEQLRRKLRSVLGDSPGE